MRRLSYWLFFFLILSVSSISQRHPPPQVLGSSVRQGGGTPRWQGPCSADSAGHAEGPESWVVQCLAAAVAGPLLYQLALTASMSLTKFWARQIPKICSNAMPMNIPATMVKLSCNHFSNWGTQPFV